MPWAAGLSHPGEPTRLPEAFEERDGTAVTNPRGASGAPRDLCSVLEQAIALIDTFNKQQVGDTDCTHDARAKLAALRAALEGARLHSVGKAIQTMDVNLVERYRHNLQSIGLTCGPRTRLLMEDIARLFDGFAADQRSEEPAP